MAIHEQKPHFVLLPFMAQGHMIPMVDIARLLARRGVTVTILTTPRNSNRFKTSLSRAIDSGLSIHLIHLHFPCIEVGLPEGYEVFDMTSSLDDALKFFKACAMLKDQVYELLEEMQPSLSCLLADMCFPWATNVALSLNVPRILFHGMSCFSLLCMHILATSKYFEDVTSDNEYFVIPGLPDRIEITKAQIIGTAKQIPSDWIEIRQEMRNSEVEAFGIVVNTFDELEPKYIEEYKKVKEKKVWCIGPVSLCNKDDLDKAERGNKSSILDEKKFLEWLDSMESSSVLYVCLGSLASLSTLQLVELGLALEASGRPFIWVIRNASKELETWILEEKFEEMISKGILVRGWAPQVLILSHPSVGGFLTHCGWNSTLEGITAGLPMITWPVLAEQFCNEKFIVNVIKTGLRVGVEVPVIFGEEEKVGVQVKSDEIKTVIDELMDGGKDGEERRERAQKLGEAATRAPQEGGTSYNNMTLLIQDVINYQVTQFANGRTTILDHENSAN